MEMLALFENLPNGYLSLSKAYNNEFLYQF